MSVAVTGAEVIDEAVPVLDGGELDDTEDVDTDPPVDAEADWDGSGGDETDDIPDALPVIDVFRV